MDSEVFGKFLREELKPEAIAYIGENNDFGRQMLEVLKKELSELPNNGIASASLFDITQSDFNALLAEAKASGADTLFTGGSNVEQYANIIRGAAEIGFKPEHVVLAPGTLNQRVVDLAGDAADGAVSVDIYVPSFDNPLNERFVEAYKAAYDQVPEKTEELTFEAVWLIAKAIDKAGTAEDTEAVAEALRGNSWETPRGTVTFDENGQAISDTFVVQVKDDEIVRR
jgi:branched-chain amino acid transport system substrate-binding protein